MYQSKVNTMKIKCPHCGAESAWQENPFRPFCSERCRLIDLGAWVSGEYRIPGKEAAAAEDDDIQ
ncbi:MAG TPA: DNA gyrase inhibitor YacG [Geobacteraceae bacterium]